uniref:ribosomal protein S15 n=1 Tax=Pellia epiphylla TaxID=40340 RepID=UPI00257A9934|nr:ribosomal protein S15 [Pellia epiphylla]WIA67438.1 ribosomal protein S15 [Pellia epiphylla var. borealis]WIA67523.1 ribosomal protein S15 [Pellia epiphylla var. borealis]WIA67961.1 ribosomal protein S15 [Pellia epiphylla]WIA68046.1 ribosomal protein S15 [Pellia epiphylla]WIA68132.1 ribosomal protein S15 [Pellia epiphylla]
MSRSSFIRLSPVFREKEGSIESQISHLTNRVSKLNNHFRRHSKDYSSQRGLWKILGKRKRLLVYLLKTNLMGYENLTNQLGIRRLKTN